MDRRRAGRDILVCFFAYSSDHNHTWTSTRPCHGSKKNIPGQNYHFYRLFTFTSGTALYRSYFGVIFCCHGSNLRLVLGHSRTTPQVVFFTRSWQKPWLALNALFTWPEKASRKRQALETPEQFHRIPMNKKNPANNLLWCLKLQVGSGVNHIPPPLYSVVPKFAKKFKSSIGVTVRNKIWRSFVTEKLHEILCTMFCLTIILSLLFTLFVYWNPSVFHFAFAWSS